MEWIEILKAFILGIVEGITEWLPISSTGHMILVEKLIGFKGNADFIEMFRVVIQLGAILAVVVLFWKKIFPFSIKKPVVKMDIMTMWFKILVACVPAGIIGIKFDDDIDKVFYNYQTVGTTLIIYGILFILVENWNKKRNSKVNDLSSITYKVAFIIGMFQVLSLIPGTSRSGATIIGALLLGTSRAVAAEFTFFLAIPVMFGASFIKVIGFQGYLTSNELISLMVAMVTAFIVSIFAILFLMEYIKKHDFKTFGYYRIGLGAIVILYFLFQ